MELTSSGLLDKIRGLAAARESIDRVLAAAVAEALEARVDRRDLANALGMHRSTLYRQYVTPATGR